MFMPLPWSSPPPGEPPPKANALRIRTLSACWQELRLPPPSPLHLELHQSILTSPLQLHPQLCSIPPAQAVSPLRPRGQAWLCTALPSPSLSLSESDPGGPRGVQAWVIRSRVSRSHFQEALKCVQELTFISPVTH